MQTAHALFTLLDYTPIALSLSKKDRDYLNRICRRTRGVMMMVEITQGDRVCVAYSECGPKLIGRSAGKGIVVFHCGINAQQ